MQSDEIRSRFLKFFENRGHKIIPSSSLVPENDPTTLFTGSGMQPMVPYLLGQKHPLGTRIADSQKSFRTVDIDEVGDNRHTTFFEMLGNWSLGDFFKKEQIRWMFEFLIDEIGIDPKKLYITAFIGDKKNNIPKDVKVVELWKELFVKKGIIAKDIEIGSEENGYKMGMQGSRIFYYDAKKNWWSRAGVPEKMPAGEPGGPDSEMFYEFTDVKHDKKFGENCHPNCDCGRFLEVGNNVFMEYKKDTDGTFSKLPQHNVDFGGGLERLAMATNNCPDIIEINHRPILDYLEKVSGKKYGKNPEEVRAFRVIADHIKAAVFLISDGINPGNTDREYFVRRLIRRSVRHANSLGITKSILSEIVNPIAEMYKNSYPEIITETETIKKVIKDEEEKFRNTLENGLKIIEKKKQKFKNNLSEFSLSVEELFDLYSTYGFPIEMSLEELDKIRLKNIPQDIKDFFILSFKEKLKKHQELSRTSSAGMFKGGLGGTGEMETKLHTATHLLNATLRQVLGNNVMQKGSNITTERLRFDFTHPQKMTEEEKKRVEEIVNDKIAEKLPVSFMEIPKAEAEKIAVHSFNEKYGDIVKVYFIGNEKSGYFSREFCGGPHVLNTGELGNFKILKEEAVAQGIRRIKAVLV
ncbi:MAG: alanine--tRNA ligase-related protein [Patescibacteria group bacterium]